MQYHKRDAHIDTVKIHRCGDLVVSDSPWDFLGSITGVGCLCPGDLPNPGLKPGSLAWQADSLPTEPSGQDIEHPI